MVTYSARLNELLWKVREFAHKETRERDTLAVLRRLLAVVLRRLLRAMQ